MKMKKLKRLLAGVMTAAMVMSTMAMTALADEPDTITGDRSTGKLTIIKHEAGSDTALIDGVKFGLLKLADITVGDDGVQVAITDKASENLKEGETLTVKELEEIAEGANSAAEWNALADKIDFTKSGFTKDSDTLFDYKGTTVNGKVEFNLPLGIYAVKEYDAPSQVIDQTVGNFIVSIPMTVNVKDGEGNVTDSYWNYNVTAEPKNAVTRGGVTLLKKGKVGNGEASPLAGAKFKLYRQEGSEWVQVTGTQNSDGAASDVEGVFTTGNDGTINVANLNPGKYKFVEIGLNANEDTTSSNGGYIVDKKKEYVFTLEQETVDGVTSTVLKVNGEKVENLTIEVVNEKPVVKKTVLNSDNTTYDNETDSRIGKLVTWKVEATIPTNIKELQTYTITDTMSAGLTYDPETADLQVAVTKSEETTEVLLTEGADKDYTLDAPISSTAGATWAITFTEAGKEKLATGDTVVITFKTLVNENAVVGKGGNLNTVTLKYSNEILPDDSTDKPKTSTDEDKAVVYTFGIGVLKIDGKNETTKLQGVEFDLYKYTGDKTSGVKEADLTNSVTGEKIEVSDNAGSYIVDNAGTAKLTTDENGNITVNGLENGVYYLVETKTVDDYNLLKEPVRVEIEVSYSVTETKTTVTNADGTTTTTSSIGGTNNNGIVTTTIKNNKGFELPTTGGFGTILFSVIGILLMAGGAVVLFRANKKKTA